MLSLKAVVLDWAGTTVDYGCFAPVVVFLEVFARRGVPITMEEARAPMGTYKKAHIRAITEMAAVAQRWQQAHGRPPCEDDVEAMFRDFVPLQMDCLARYAELIPGTLEAVAEFRRRGLKVGSTTGYTREMMQVLLPEAARRGYQPDCCVCPDEVPAGRPYPWMCFQNAMQLRVYPMAAMVKIGDTQPDIAEGLNAGMWTIAVAGTGNELGLTEVELAALDSAERETRQIRARARLRETGAHYVVDSVADVPPLLDQINQRLATGERP